MNLPLAVLMGLAGSSTAFLQSVRPTNFVVPAHKYNAAVSRARAVQPRAAVAGRNMRIMSAAVDTETDADTAEATSAVEIPVAVEDPISPALEVRKDDTQRHTHRETRVAESYVACARDQRCRSRACREVFAPFYFVPFFATCHVAPGVCVWLGYSEVCCAWRAHRVYGENLAAAALSNKHSPWQVVATRTTCDGVLRFWRLHYVRQQQPSTCLFFSFVTHVFVSNVSAGPQKQSPSCTCTS